MFPRQHIIAGLIFAVIWKIVFSVGFLEASVLFLSSFLIDIDHYLCYVLWKKDFSLKNSYRWFADEGKRYDALPKELRKNYSLGVFPLHGVEVLSLIFLLGFYYNTVFFFIFLGFLFHLTADFVWEMIYAKRALYRFSLIYSLLYKWPK